jgi:hypothetical protein
MAVTHKWYGPGMKNVQNGNITSLSSSDVTIKCALLSSDHTFTQSHETWSQIVANEVTSTDYSTGGVALSNKMISYADRITTFATSSDSWETTFTSTGSITARYGVVYHEGSSAATSYLLSCVDFGETRSCAVGTFKITWDSSGILQTTVSS